MSGKPSDNAKKSIAYTITAGYYPELASRIKFGGRLTGGKGAMGAKYVQKRGFSSSSLRRIPYEKERGLKSNKNPKGGQRGTGYSQEFEFDEFMYNTFFSDSHPTKAGQVHSRRSSRAFLKRPKDNFGSVKERVMNQGMLGLTEAGNPQSLRSLGYGKGTPVGQEGSLNPTFHDLSKAAQAAESNLQKISYTKWMGGTELHKLYGTKVWYEEGIRGDRKGLDKALVDWGNAIKEGNPGELPDQFLTEMYSRAQSSKLVDMASKFALDLFEGAYEMGELEKDLLSVGGGKADVAEEDVEEARDAVKGKRKDFFRSTDLSIDKASKAQKLDVLTKDREGRDVYLDSTEVAMTGDVGHGIVDLDGGALQTVKKAINALGPDGDIQSLKILVQRLFISNIGREYNPAIQKMKDLVIDQGIKTDKDATMSFKDILKSVDKRRKEFNKEMKKSYDAKKAELYISHKATMKSDLKMGDPTRGTPNDTTRYMQNSVMNIAAGMGRVMRTGSTKAGQEKTISTQTMKYVVHMLASLGDNQTRQFRQGHRLFTYPDNTKVYASVPMSLHEKGAKSLLFKTKGFRSPEGTLILHGESHLLALAVHNGAVKRAQTAQIAKRQSQAHATRLITGHSSISEKKMKFESDSKLKMDTIPATVVVFNPKKLDEVFQKIMGVFQKGRWKGKDVGRGRDGYNTEQHKFEKKAKDLMDDMVYSWPEKPYRKNTKPGSIRAKGENLTQTNMFNGNKFWALPYIGINDNVYRGSGKDMQK